MARSRVKKRWEFCWCDANSPPTNGDCHDWQSKVYRAETFEKAMDKMLRFIKSRPFECFVDYECCALHEPYNSTRFNAKQHEKAFPRIDLTEHELSEYVG